MIKNITLIGEFEKPIFYMFSNDYEKSNIKNIRDRCLLRHVSKEDITIEVEKNKLIYKIDFNNYENYVSYIENFGEEEQDFEINLINFSLINKTKVIITIESKEV